MKKEVINFLNKCNLVFDNVEQLNGMEIPRDILLSKQKYEEIIECKESFTGTYLKEKL